VSVSKRKPWPVAVLGSTTAGTCALLIATTGITLTTTLAFVLPEFMLWQDTTSGPDSILSLPVKLLLAVFIIVVPGSAKREIAGA